METAQGGTVLGNAIRNPHSVVRTAYTLYGRVDRPRTFAKLWLIFLLIRLITAGAALSAAPNARCAASTQLEPGAVTAEGDGVGALTESLRSVIED